MTGIKRIKLQRVITRGARESRIWMAHDDQLGVWIADVFIRQKEGVRYFTGRYHDAKPSLKQLRQEARLQGYLSSRPYHLGQAQDASITMCVLALFDHFCQAHEKDPMDLLRQACEELYTKEDFLEIRRTAEWEGIVYPSKWDRPAVDQLVKSLRNIHHDVLATFVEKLADTLV